MVGYHGEIDYELLAEIHPQVVITYTGIIPEAEEKMEGIGIKLVRLSCFKPETFFCDIRVMGMILDRNEGTTEFLDFIHENLDLVQERVENLQEEERKRVYWESSSEYNTCGKDSTMDRLMVMAGSSNIFGDIEVDASSFDVSPEEILTENPQMVVKHSGWGLDVGGYLVSDPSAMAAIRDEMMRRPGWDELDAVENNNVFIMHPGLMWRPRNIVGVCYMAKWLYPDIFQDLDPEAFHKEWLEEYYGIDYEGIYVCSGE
jgi:iron complex transport system substrate-binding protein